MFRIEDWRRLADPGVRVDAPEVAANDLPELLDGAAVTAVVVDDAASLALTMLDTRQAYAAGNTAVVVAGGTRDVALTAARREPPVRHRVDAVTVTTTGDAVELALGLLDGRVVVAARRLVVLFGEVEGLPEAPPDYATSLDAIAALTASPRDVLAPSGVAVLTP